ncbi:ChaN family lipoprotein [Celeribacter persicus]|uniref:Putative iron-regulated protein n=1 Tax=Celeribacter persicus TaxID=1651082 RepID=A0A2T5HGS3_9RHOB|nr:ChaN family lipoprotein [Celeribacter persicus]PTQ70769.1 putative iron-regulated protein [Celeribacter persicus]
MREIIALAVVLTASPVYSDQITPEALESLPPADVVILGEIHDNPFHHEHQTRAVAAFAPKAIVFEMLSPEQAKVVTPELRNDEAALAAVLEWESSGWPDFSMYYSIFIASDAPVYGAALPREAVRAAFSEGAAKSFGEEAVRYGLDRALPEEVQAARETLQFEAHCAAMPLNMMSGMVEAQRLRDAGFSRTVIEAYEDTGGPVAVITGNGHARTDWGMPAALSLAAPELRVLSIGQLEDTPEETPPYDLWLVTLPVERDDPCAGFAVPSGDGNEDGG